MTGSVSLALSLDSLDQTQSHKWTRSTPSTGFLPLLSSCYSYILEHFHCLSSSHLASSCEHNSLMRTQLGSDNLSFSLRERIQNPAITYWYCISSWDLQDKDTHFWSSNHQPNAKEKPVVIERWKVLLCRLLYLQSLDVFKEECFVCMAKYTRIDYERRWSMLSL